jgi:hypothetical protein
VREAEKDKNKPKGLSDEEADRKFLHMVTALRGVKAEELKEEEGKSVLQMFNARNRHVCHIRLRRYITM